MSILFALLLVSGAALKQRLTTPVDSSGFLEIPAYDFLRIPTYGFAWTFGFLCIPTFGFMWISCLDFIVFLWIHMVPADSHGFLWILLESSDSSVPMDSCGFIWIPIDSYGFL